MVDFIINHLNILILLSILFFVIPIIFRFFIKSILIILMVMIGGSFLFGPQFISYFHGPITKTQELAQTTIQPLIKKEIQNAKFSYDPQTKLYVIKSSLFKLQGLSDQNKADLIINGKKHTINISFLKNFIEKQIAQETFQQTNINMLL